MNYKNLYRYHLAYDLKLKDIRDSFNSVENKYGKGSCKNAIAFNSEGKGPYIIPVDEEILPIINRYIC